MKKNIFLLIIFLFISTIIFSQKPNKLNSNQIYEKVKKLNFLGSALYIAAHPDDENTRLIAYLANTTKARTGYLSLTRGDGGQNLIGPEIRELLGVIRTQELLAARKIDGGEQFFTRANDFGYSKHPDETLKIWEKEKVLSDIVWIIRKFKPDVIINRFNHMTPGSTHGHHTSSAILSFEAFDLANNKTKFPQQLSYTSLWQPQRLFFNTSAWFYNSKLEFEKDTKGKLTSFDVGVYYPLKGLSNNELASMASSKHLCQGFGRLSNRGEQKEYLEFLKGSPLKDQNDIFSGINTTWNRLKNGGEIGDILYAIEEKFNFINPSKHIPELLKAYSKIQLLEDTHWAKIKEKQILEVIEASAGLYLEASAVKSSSIPNSSIEVNFEAINRSEFTIDIISLKILPSNRVIEKKINLISNKRSNFKEILSTKELAYSSPYWLVNKSTLGMYSVDNKELIGNPESSVPIKVQFNISINNIIISITKNVLRRYAKIDQGEIYEPYEILPKVTTKFKDKVMIFSDDKIQKVSVEVSAGDDNVSGKVMLEAPDSWLLYPKKIDFLISQKKDKQIFDFYLVPPKNESEGILKLVAISDDKKFTNELIEINYNHIPKQSVLMQSEAKIVRLNIQKTGTNIAYIKGAGDSLPENLRQIGYTVVIIKPEDITTENLQKYDAIVLGIRAYNIVKELKFKQKFLLEYVKNGGNMVVQYNTIGEVDIASPFPLRLSRDRVTNEFAQVIILDDNHPLLNFPNKITNKDFKGWVQERGLYFPDSWSKEFTPILSMNDIGEEPKTGSLLIAKYGKGNYIYTGLSFFRQMPAGVPGAYKLFANMLSVRKNEIEIKKEINK